MSEQEILEQLKNICKISSGTMGLDDFLELAELDKKQLFTVIKKYGFDGIAIHWSEQEISFDADILGDEIDKLIQELVELEQQKQNKPSSVLVDPEGDLPPEFGEYDDVILHKKEAEALAELEKILGKKIPLSSSSKTGFEHLHQSVVHLYLRECRIESVPKCILGFTNLKKLYLDNNLLTAIPGFLGKLVNIEQLHIQSNNITVISDQLVNLEKLTYLNLQGNQIKLLPEEIGQLSSLTHLNLDNNKLNTIPVSIGKLENLKLLYFRNVKFTFLPIEAEQALASLKKNGCTVYR